jgi:hypothetical protein
MDGDTKPPAKKRGRPAGSKNKPKVTTKKKTTTKKKATPKKSSKKIETVTIPEVPVAEMDNMGFGG